MGACTSGDTIALLTKLRDVHQGQLDAGVIVEINAVIAALKSCDCEEKEADLSPLILRLIGDIVRIVTNVTDLMQ